MRRFRFEPAVATALVMSVCGVGFGASQAATAQRSAFLDTPLANSVFAEAPDGGIKHRGSGLVCPATLGGIKLSATQIGRTASTEGNASCNYGPNDSELHFALMLAPLKAGKKPADIANAFYIAPNLKAAPLLLPLGRPDGPKAGRFVVDGKETFGILVTAKGGWSLTFVTGYTQARAAEARSVATDTFKKFQEAKP